MRILFGWWPGPAGGRAQLSVLVSNLVLNDIMVTYVAKTTGLISRSVTFLRLLHADTTNALRLSLYLFACYSEKRIREYELRRPTPA